MRPTIARMVHYVSLGSAGGEFGRECRAAVVTEVTPSATDTAEAHQVGLCVMNPTGQYFNQGVPHDGGRPDREGGTNLCGGLDYKGGSWHWPEIVREAGDRPPRH